MGGEVVVVSFLNVKNANVLVLGAGVTGKAVTKVLSARGLHVAMVDEDSTRTGEKVITLETAKSSDWDFVVVSPGWRHDHPLVTHLRSKNFPLVSEVDLAWQLKIEIAPKQKWLAVTGTNGKTSTVELATAMLRQGGLKARACGNVGETIVEAITNPEKFDFLVVELSSFQLQWSNSPEFHASALLNIADDHVDWHGSFSKYVAAKARILDRTELAILNADDGDVVRATQHWQGRKVFFSLDTPSPGEIGLVENLLIDRAFVSDPQEASVLAQLDDVHPAAPHSVSNTLAAAALARSVGVSYEDIRSATQTFRPGRHRIEVVAEVGGFSWINDSKATNPHAAAASLASQLSVVWIAGGLAKGATMDQLISRTKSRIRAAILIGADRELIAQQLVLQAPQVPIVRINPDPPQLATLMERVVLEAKRLAQPGDVVMLAPACASMDQFISYADRGDQFRAAVKKLVVEA